MMAMRRKKNTNPGSDKILLICAALEVTPEYLLSGVSEDSDRALGVRYKLIYYKLNKIGCCIYVCMYSLIKNGTEKSVLFFVRNGLILPKVRQ